MNDPRRSNNAGHRQSPIQAKLAAPPPISATNPSDPNADHGGGPKRQSALGKTAVLAILFLVTGCLGVPLLWISKSFSNRERIFWSVVVTLYTAILIGIVVWILAWSLRQIGGLA